MPYLVIPQPNQLSLYVVPKWKGSYKIPDFGVDIPQSHFETYQLAIEDD